MKQLFQVNETLIEDQKEISHLTTIDYKKLTSRSTSLLCDGVLCGLDVMLCHLLEKCGSLLRSLPWPGGGEGMVKFGVFPVELLIIFQKFPNHRLF